MSPQHLQSGVISRVQVLAAGESESDIERRLARREWARIRPGIYVDHTGPPTWLQLAWAAVLTYWPAALAGPSALHAAGVRGHEPKDGTPIYICVDRTRSVRRTVGITVHQIARSDSLCTPHIAPPRQRVEHALLDVASRKKRLESSIAVLADAVQGGYTTPSRLLAALEERPKLRHRAFLRGVLVDVAEGVRSVLEYRYLTRVERAHGLPRAKRQRPVRVGDKRGYQDVEYVAQRVVVHLDGKLAHTDTLDRWADLDRDLAGTVDGTLDVRIGWAQVLQPCRLASSVGTILVNRGWEERPRRCGPMCTTSLAPGAGDVVQTG